MSTFTAEAMQLLKRLEGLRLDAYQDEAGVWTIGYGHTRGVVPGLHWTTDQAGAALAADVATFVAGVRQLVQVELSDNQFSALVIFAYNVGLRALAGSTVLRHLNAGYLSAVPDAMKAWCHVHVGGVLQVSPGLMKRRAAEVGLWAGP